MAWETGSFVTTDAGELISVFDVDLVANAKWSIFDAAAGTNCKVYRCYDAAENVDFYVKVDDNYTGYAVIELWEGWNEGTHTGTGSSLTTCGGYAMQIYRPIGGWLMSVRNHRFIFINATYCGTYIGQLVRYDTTKNMPVYIGSQVQTDWNTIVYYDSASLSAWWTLFDEIGSQRLLCSYGYYTSYKFIKTIAGTMLISETPIFNDTSKLVLGLMEGSMHLYDADNGLANGDIISINGIEWIAIGGLSSPKYWNLVEKA